MEVNSAHHPLRGELWLLKKEGRRGQQHFVKIAQVRAQKCVSIAAADAPNAISCNRCWS